MGVQEELSTSKTSNITTCGLLLAALVPYAAIAQIVDRQNESIAPGQTAPVATHERLDKRRVFRPDFYAVYRPQTALDMVLNTPGFQLSLGTSGRGLAGATGNVLINGVRPPAKATSITQVLSAISADEVKIVLLVPAGSMDVDMAGYSVLLYLVTLSKPGLERTATVGATDSGALGGSRTVEAEARASRPRRLLTRNFSGSQDRTLIQGALVAPLIGQRMARRVGGSKLELDSARLSTMGQWQLQSGGHLQLHINLSQLDSTVQPLAMAEDPAALDRSSETLQRAGDVASELQWPFAKGRGELAMTALHSRTDTQASSRVQTLDRDSASHSRSTGGESALRSALRWKLSDIWRLQFGADYAVNFLDGDFSYHVDGVEIEVPGSLSRVEEMRSGVFTSATWTPDPRWSTGIGMRWERSQMHNIFGETQLGRFDDLLPRLATTWISRSGTKFEAGIERKVGQLAFSQFLASVKLTDDIITAGAPVLQPERSWVYSAGFERRLGERGLLSVDVKRQRIDNPIDAIVLDDDTQVSANVDAMTIDSLQLEFTVPLDRLGLRGGLLTASKREVFSRTTDPMTRERRPASLTPSSSSLLLRQDLPNGAWGLSLTGDSDSIAYSVRQVVRTRSEAGASVFREWRLRASLALRLTYSLSSRKHSDMWFYAMPRAVGQAADLSYLAATWIRPIWQAKLEWNPTPLARLELGATTGSDTLVTGRTMLPDGKESVERLALSSQAKLSAQVKLRW